MMSETWVIVPVYNEAPYLPRVLKKLSQNCDNFVVVDDGSVDGSELIAKKFTPHVLSHEVNLGKGAALKTACDYAFLKLKAQAVIFMDGDDQHDSQNLKLFADKLNSGFDVVFGERSMDHKMPLLRIIGNRVASFLVLFFFGQYIADIPSGFKAISRKAYPKVRWDASGYDIELELSARVARYKLKFDMVPINTIYHDFDRGMTLIDALQIFIKLIILKITL